jgi:hypothetical protein
MFMLNPVWSKKKTKTKTSYCSNWKKRERNHCSSSPLANSHRNQNCHCSSSMTAISSGTPAISGASAIHRSRPTTTEKTTALAHRSTPIYYLRHRSAAPPQQTFGFSIQTNITNHQPQPPTNPPQPAPTGDLPQQGQRNRSLPATIHSALTFSSDNGSTSPRPTARSQTPQSFPCTANPKHNHRSTSLAPSPSAVATNYRRQPDEGNQETKKNSWCKIN